MKVYTLRDFMSRWVLPRIQVDEFYFLFEVPECNSPAMQLFSASRATNNASTVSYVLEYRMAPHERLNVPDPQGNLGEDWVQIVIRTDEIWLASGTTMAWAHLQAKGALTAFEKSDYPKRRYIKQAYDSINGRN